MPGVKCVVDLVSGVGCKPGILLDFAEKHNLLYSIEYHITVKMMDILLWRRKKIHTFGKFLKTIILEEINIVQQCLNSK